MTPKIQVEQISFGYSETTEGVPDARGKKFTGPDAWKQANSWLMHRAAMLPHDMMGYLKHDFTIRWQDGYEYKGRYDLEPLHGTGDFEGLDAHIRNHVLFHAGLRRPAHMTEEKYAEYLKAFTKPEQRAEYAAWIDKYQVGEELTQPSSGVTMKTVIVEVPVTVMVPEDVPESEVARMVDNVLERVDDLTLDSFPDYFSPSFGKAKAKNG